MTDTKDSIVKVFSPRRLLIAFFIGAGIHFITYLIFGRASGPVGTLLMPFFSLFYTAKLIVFSILAGLLLHYKLLNDLWFKNTLTYKITIIIGLACFVFGTISADNAYYDNDNQNEAQNYYYYLTNPGFVILLFALGFRPIKN